MAKFKLAYGNQSIVTLDTVICGYLSVRETACMAREGNGSRLLQWTRVASCIMHAYLDSGAQRTGYLSLLRVLLSS